MKSVYIVWSVGTMNLGCEAVKPRRLVSGIISFLENMVYIRAMKRNARFAGLWYPDDPEELLHIVSSRPRRAGDRDCRFAVLPHAGLYYSGELIASFFAVLAKDIDHIVIVAPSHYHYLKPGVLYTARFTESETPLGTIPTVPLWTSRCIVDDQAIADEHALEMFLPFIAAKKGISVSYGLVSQIAGMDGVKALAEDLSPLVGPRSGLIASSDFTHYGRRFGHLPYGSGPDAVDNVVENDLSCADSLAKGDIADVLTRFASSGTICGIAPAMVASRLAAMRNLSGHVDGHAVSLDKGGGRGDDFVSYVTIFWG